jgi:hypothetical protein
MELYLDIEYKIYKICRSSVILENFWEFYFLQNIKVILKTTIWILKLWTTPSHLVMLHCLYEAFLQEEGVNSI